MKSRDLCLSVHQLSACDVFGLSLNNSGGSREDNVLLSHFSSPGGRRGPPSGATTIWVSFAQIPSDQKVAHTLLIFATLSSRRWTACEEPPRCCNDNSAKVSRPCRGGGGFDELRRKRVAMLYYGCVLTHAIRESIALCPRLTEMS